MMREPLQQPRLHPAWAAVACVLTLAACAKKDAADDTPKLTAQVTTAVLADGTLDRTITAYGAAEFAPDAERTLAAPIEAKVARVLLGAGARVGAGQAVIVLSPSPQTQIDLKKAADDARTSREAYDRAVRLKASGLDSNADVETARAADVVAQATLASLQSRAAGLTVTSPVAGVIETLTAAPGDLVATGASLGKVGQLGSTRVHLALDPRSVSSLRAGESVRLQPAGGGAETSGVVTSVDPAIDPQTRLASVIVRAQGLAPGLALKGEVVTGQASGPVAPHGAIYYDQDQPYVLVVQGGVAHRRDVKLGPEQDDRVEIASGVKAGERIVTEGGASLDDGTAVKEAPAAGPNSVKDAG